MGAANPLLENTTERTRMTEQEAPAPEAPAAAVAPPPVILETPDALLTAALAAAQAAFPRIEKNKTATVTPNSGKPGYSYTYADLGDVLAAVRPVLAANGIATVQTTQRAPQGNGWDLITTLRHVAGGELTTVVELGQQPGNPQAFGGALTYLRRYELATVLGIAPEEDLDASNVEPAGSGGSGGRTREVPPAWAAAAGRETKAKLRALLTRELGGHQATADRYAGALAKATGGAFPETVARWLSSLDDWRAAAAAAIEEEAANAERAKQDRDAEQPDEPAAPARPAIPADEDLEKMPAGALAELADSVGINTDGMGKPDVLMALRNRRRGSDGNGGTDTAPAEPDDDPPPSDEELEAAAAEQREPSGTVDNPYAEASELDEEAIAHLRELGCICPDPTVEVGRMDDCPLKGHGIPF